MSDTNSQGATPIDLGNNASVSASPTTPIQPNNDQASSAPTDDSSVQAPTSGTDDSTKKRFKNLAIIGTFLFQISNDNAEQTEYFLAKSALTEFAAEVKLLDLDFETRAGVDNLISYMDKKIEKRNRQAGGEFSKD